MSMTFSAHRLNGSMSEPVFGFDSRTEDSINVSNANGAAILEALGYDPEHFEDGTFFGEIVPFLAACDAWLVAGHADPGRPATVDAAPGRMTFHNCGRPADYLRSRIEELADIARRGLSAGATHICGA